MAEKKGPLIGAYVPQCDEDGYYTLKQCWASTGSCWCVDKFGKKIEGESTNAGQDLACGEFHGKSCCFREHTYIFSTF